MDSFNTIQMEIDYIEFINQKIKHLANAKYYTLCYRKSFHDFQRNFIPLNDLQKQRITYIKSKISDIEKDLINTIKSTPLKTKRYDDLIVDFSFADIPDRDLILYYLHCDIVETNEEALRKLTYIHFCYNYFLKASHVLDFF